MYKLTLVVFLEFMSRDISLQRPLEVQGQNVPTVLQF